MDLIIVESPTKAKTISKFLSRQYKVRSSFGHIRDLPKKYLGIDLKHNFRPGYIIPPEKKKMVAALKKEAEKAKVIIMATDPDREGEAIAWHLAVTLKLVRGGKPLKNAKPLQRIVFHEITKSAIKKSLDNPGNINYSLVNAQQARRVLDRLVGYKLSPFLWKKVAKGLSAGRVQSVALRLIVEREKEIEAFNPTEYYIVKSKLQNPNDKKTFEADVVKIGGKTVPKPGIKTKKEAETAVKEIKENNLFVDSVERKEVKRHPQPPLITSTLQQTAANKFGFSAKQTMRIAQQLYEGISLGEKGAVGLITYMRTDSLHVSSWAIAKAEKVIAESFGDNYVKIRRYKTKSKTAQEAHEAIRPTDALLNPDKIRQFLDDKQFKLYALIWQRFIASQMAEAVFDATKISISTENKKYELSATGQVIKFDGFLRVYATAFDQTILPSLKEGQKIGLIAVAAEQHFTKPPGRFTDASLIRALEKNEIGRPSTYAPILSTIQSRNYVFKEKRYYHPTEIGITVNDMLVKHFPNIVNLEFTSHVEADLDKIANGKEDWIKIIRDFYEPFAAHLAKKYEEVAKEYEAEVTDEICDKCKKGRLVIRMSRYGKFLGCDQFPECRNIKQLEKEADKKSKK